MATETSTSVVEVPESTDRTVVGAVDDFVDVVGAAESVQYKNQNYVMFFHTDELD